MFLIRFMGLFMGNCSVLHEICQLTCNNQGTASCVENITSLVEGHLLISGLGMAWGFNPGYHQVMYLTDLVWFGSCYDT